MNWSGTEKRVIQNEVVPKSNDSKWTEVVPKKEWFKMKWYRKLIITKFIMQEIHTENPNHEIRFAPSPNKP